MAFSTHSIGDVDRHNELKVQGCDVVAEADWTIPAIQVFPARQLSILPSPVLDSPILISASIPHAGRNSATHS